MTVHQSRDSDGDTMVGSDLFVAFIVLLIHL
jgi:hypothetical protein